MVVETAWCVWLRRHHVALWQYVEPHPFRDGAPVEPRLTDNRGDAVAGKLQRFHPVEHVRKDGPAACRNQLPVFHQRWLPPVTNPSSDCHGLGRCIRRRGLPRGPRGAAQLLLDRLSEVLQQVEAIGGRGAPKRLAGHRGSPRRAPEASPPALNPSRKTPSALLLPGLCRAVPAEGGGRDLGSAAGEGLSSMLPDRGQAISI
jgi:hypothetical protein